MGRTEELEAALRADWNDDVLSVYADHLQSLGDPRGELIAFDLDGDDGELAIRRSGELIRMWLGSDLEIWWEPANRRWYAGHKEAGPWIVANYGLLEVTHSANPGEQLSETLQEFLHSAASRFVHRCSFSADTPDLRRAIASLTSQERPWLRALCVRRLDRRDEPALPDTTPFGTTLQNLTHLELAGHRVLDDFDHAGVTALVVTGPAISLAAGPPLSSVKTLDFAFEPGSMSSGVHHHLRRERLPGVRRLGLSRQEPNEPLELRRLSDLELASQLVHLELPALRSHADVVAVELAADRMPNLRELVIARAYMRFGDRRVELARANVLHPVAWPWPPIDELDGRALNIHTHTATLPPLIDALELLDDQLPSDVRATWFRIWTKLATAGSLWIQPAALHAAIAALGLDDPDWQAAAAALEGHHASIHLSYTGA